jgi:hypothetical protein
VCVLQLHDPANRVKFCNWIVQSVHVGESEWLTDEEYWYAFVQQGSATAYTSRALMDV